MSSIASFSPVAELARIVVAAALSRRTDVYSVDVLSELTGLSRRAFHNRCQAAGITGRDCLHFVQCLKAVLAAGDEYWDPAALIPVTDPRTLQKILSQARIEGRERPTIPEFVSRQEFCKSSSFSESVLQALDQAQRSELTATQRSR